MRLHHSVAHLAGRLLSHTVAHYITSARDRLVGNSVLLAPGMKREFGPYFERELLEEARLVASDFLELPAVPFESFLRRFGVYIPSNELVSAVTFNDVVAVREKPSTRLLFHELVHVAQFRLLGVPAFAQLYVRGFLAEGSYDAIPLERSASTLEERFQLGERFSVEADVKSWIERDLL